MFEYMGSFYINKETRSGNYALGLTVQGLGSGALSPEPYTRSRCISSLSFSKASTQQSRTLLVPLKYEYMVPIWGGKRVEGGSRIMYSPKPVFQVPLLVPKS